MRRTVLSGLQWNHFTEFDQPYLQLIITLLFIFASISSNCQISPKDSLEIANIINHSHQHLINHRYQQAKEKGQQALNQSTQLNFKWGMINSLLLLAQAERSTPNFPNSLNYYLQALAEIEKQNDIKTLQWVNSKIGELFQSWGVPEKALPYYKTALSLQKEKSPSLIERIAEVHLSMNQKEQSLSTYHQLLDILKAKGDTLQIKSVLEKIAGILYRSNDVEGSLKYNLQILEINKQLKNDAGTAATLNTIGYHYKDLKNSDKALEYYQAALALNQKSNNNGQNDNAIATNLINIGVIHQTKGDYRSSIKNFNQALQVKERNGTPIEISVLHNYLATLYLNLSNLSEAEKHTKEAIRLLTGTDNKKMLAANYKRLSEIYSKQNNYEKALVNYQIYSLFKDSLLYQEQLAQEREIAKEHAIETTEKEAKLSLIDYEMQSLELQAEKEIAERERQKVELLLTEKELQNISLQNSQLEQTRKVQLLQLQQNKIEKETQEQSIELLQQKQKLQEAELQRNELLEKERSKEIDFKNTRLELQQSQLERASIQQRYLIYTATLFLLLVLLILVGYFIKQRDNKKLMTQYEEINQQKNQIESINQELINLNEEKNDLIGIVAHDLKSPLNQISGVLEILRLSAPEDIVERKLYIQKITDATNRLRQMITKILDVNAIESKTLNITPEEANLHELLTDTISRFTQLAEKKGIEIVKEFDEESIIIKTDKGYLSEVFENLLSNAVKYSPFEKPVTVKLHQNSTNVRIEFIDQGQGISAGDMKNLFGKYRKLSARPTAGEDSTGLGLSIVKKYVEALHGKVWCESQEGQGSNFIVEIPIR